MTDLAMDTEPYLRAAYAIGVAEVEHDGDVHEAFARRVRYAGLDLMLRSEEHGRIVLEAARRSGRHAAVQATIHEHLDEIERKFHILVRPIMGQVLSLVRSRIARFAEALVQPTLAEAADPNRQRLRDQIRAILNDLADSEAMQQWVRLTSDARYEGGAVGTLAGESFAATTGVAIPEFDVEFPAAVDAMRALGDAWADPETWMAKQLDGLAYTLGNQLADHIAARATYDEMLQTVADVTDDESNGAALMLDHAISTAVSDGTLMLYRSESVDMVDILVSPDACEICEGLEGDNPYPLDEADGGIIPAHPNCVPEGTAVEALGRLEAALRARYIGYVVVIQTASGRKLRATPNHPVLTWSGWVQVQALRQGDHVVSVREAQRDGRALNWARSVDTADSVDHPPAIAISHSGVDLDDVPARAEDVFESLRATGDHFRTITAPSYLHGDAESAKGHIDVVRPHSTLANVVDPQPAELIFEGDLMPSAWDGRALAGHGTRLIGRRASAGASDSVMGGAGQCSPLLSAGAVHAHEHGDAAVAERNTAVMEAPRQGRTADTEYQRQGLERFTAHVALDEIVHIHSETYVGDVYDLQTSARAYVADGIIVHNCRCSWTPHLGDSGEAG